MLLSLHGGNVSWALFGVRELLNIICKCLSVSDPPGRAARQGSEIALRSVFFPSGTLG